MVIEQDWLNRIFQHLNLQNFCMNVLSREQTYLRLLYADVVGDKQDGTEQTIHCFLKYYTSGATFEDVDPRAKQYFDSERYWYEAIYPIFANFQKTKAVDTPFNNVPKCHGTILEDNNQEDIQRVIVLENVKLTGHVSWPSSDPLSRKHLETVLEAYAKLHATSTAMQKQQPQEFDDIIKAVTKLEEERNDALEVDNKRAKYEPVLVKLFHFLELNWAAKSREKKTPEKEGFVMLDVRPPTFMRVINHGDCWTNNFMSKFKDSATKTVPRDLVIVDWQMIQFRSLIYDISSFLFSYISKKDIEKLGVLLRFYYDHFCAHLKKLGIPKTDTFYSYQQFKDEWKMFCKDGLVATICAFVEVDREDVESSDVFITHMDLCQKLKYMVHYLKEHNLIEE